jgi:hypothetical protein
MKANLLRRRRAHSHLSIPARQNPTIVPLETGAYKLEAIAALLKRIRVNRQDAGKVDNCLALLEREVAGLSLAIPSPRKPIPTIERPAPDLASIPVCEELKESTASNIHLAVSTSHKWVRFITEDTDLVRATVYLHPLYPFSRFRILATDGIRAIIAPYDSPTSPPTIVHCTNLTEEKQERDINAEAKVARTISRTRRTPAYTYNIEDLL